MKAPNFCVCFHILFGLFLCYWVKRCAQFSEPARTVKPVCGILLALAVPAPFFEQKVGHARLRGFRASIHAFGVSPTLLKGGEAQTPNFRQVFRQGNIEAVLKIAADLGFIRDVLHSGFEFPASPCS